MLNIPFVDGNMLINIEEDNYCASTGCPTCSYGSSYVNDITIDTTHYKLHITKDTMYDYAISEGDLMKIILNIDIRRVTEKEFFKELEVGLREMFNCSKSEWAEMIQNEELEYQLTEKEY